jgi:hypothetical protein
MGRKNEDRPWQVFRFTFAAEKKRRNVAVASVSREEARKLIIASFRNVSGIREIL